MFIRRDFLMFRRIFQGNLFFFFQRNQQARTYLFVFQRLSERVKFIVNSGLSKRSTFYLRFGAAVSTISAKAMAEEQNLKHVLRNADQLYDEVHYQEVYDLLQKFPDQTLPEIKWRQARVLYSMANASQSKDEMHEKIRRAYELISSALEGDDKNFAIHKWMAIILDANAELDGIKARVSQLHTVKDHMLKAIELNPQDPTCWHILGKFEYNLADLSWMQRKLVTAIFARPPTGSYEQALEYLQRAEEHKAGFYSMNWLMIGKCYIALNKKDEAKKFIEKAANCRIVSEDDKKCKEEATNLLKKL